MTEEEIIQSQSKQKISVYNNIPYEIISKELDGKEKTRFVQELKEISDDYEVYELGADFLQDSSSCITPSNLRYKKIKELIDTEARFMFSQPLEINAKTIGKEKKDQDNSANEFIKKVLEKTKFNSKITKASKDCLIGKRVCCVVNFSEEKGISITFLNALQFYYEYDGDTLSKLVCFTFLNADTNKENQRILKKKYTLERNKCIISEMIFDGSGVLVEDEVMLTTDFEYIPATIIFNDGLLTDNDGESEVENLLMYESKYSELGNDDMNSEKKSMNPIKYTINASSESTENLPLGPGAYWDLQADDNGVSEKSCSTGILESAMGYSSALKNTLDRIENMMHAQSSIPNINSETLQGMITSGKTLRALYWPLTVKANEKMLTWVDSLTFIIQTIFDGIGYFPLLVKRYADGKVESKMYNITIESNYALPEDEAEEKQNDIAEVSAQLMSKKAYMIKWHKLTAEAADEELKQILLEKKLLEDSDLPNNDFTSDSNISKEVDEELL